MKRYEYLINPEIATIESSKGVIPKFSLGADFNAYSGLHHSKIKISFDVVKDLVGQNGGTKFNFYNGGEQKDELYYIKPIGLGITLKLHLKNLFDETKVTVNGSYYKLVKIKVDSVYPPGAHLADILLVNLLQRQYAPLHCGAISRHNEGTLLIAPADTGKTLTTFLALKRGFSYLAEDIAIVDQENVYANPYTSTFLHNEGYNPFFSLFRRIPILYSYVRPKASITSFINNLSIDEKAPIKNIFILDKGRNSVEEIEFKEAVRRIMIINRNEFSYYKNPLLLAYSYFNPNLRLDKLSQVEEELISKIVNKANCFLLRTNNPTEYIELLLQAMKS